MQQNMALYTGCISGASPLDQLTAFLEIAGFKDICITPKDDSKEFIKDWAPGQNVENYIVSAIIQAVK